MPNPLPPTLSIALKEWATVCHALSTGRQILLLRKGGIYESAGEFELEHNEFIFFPTYLHQNLKMLKEEAHPTFEPHTAEPQNITLSVAGTVTDIIQLKSRSQMDRLDSHHIWTPPLIDMRFNYRPENPLYLILVRAYLLPNTTIVQNTPAYAGCKSWVPLENEISTTGAQPVVQENDYDRRRNELLHL